MKFDELDTKMRRFETAADYCVLPGIFMVARLDGRSFTRLTKELCQFDVPYDNRFRDLMVTTARSLMTCGFQVRYAYLQSDEISLLFDDDERIFGRKLRKYNSTLAGEASARFSLELGQVATFDCRISQLPSVEFVVDYFRWRSEDAARNALNAWCYWTLRKEGVPVKDANEQLKGLTVGDKNEFLFHRGMNSNDLPDWQKRGIGLSWKTTHREGFDPIKQQPVATTGREIYVDLELPMKDQYDTYVRKTIGRKN